MSPLLSWLLLAAVSVVLFAVIVAYPFAYERRMRHCEERELCERLR